MKEVFVGIDAGKEHWVCVLNKQHQHVTPTFKITNSRAEYERLEKTIGRKAKICIEDTGHYSRPLFEYLKGRGYDIIMIKGRRSKKLREYIVDSMKTDVLDSFVLAMVRALETDIPAKDLLSGGTTNVFKPLVREYWAHAQRRGQMRQRVVSLLNKHYPELVEEFCEPSCPTALGIIRWTTFKDRKSVLRVIRILSKKGVQADRKDVKRALSCVQSTVGIQDGSLISLHMLIDSYMQLVRQVEVLEEQLAEHVLQSPYATLMTLPCVSLITTAVLVGEIGDIERFSNSQKFVKFCGFRFSREQSGDKDSKQLNVVVTPVTWVLSSAALNAMRNDPHLRAFADRMKKRGKWARVIRFAVARKMLVRLYHEMRKRRHMTVRDNLRILDPTKVPSSVRRAMNRLQKDLEENNGRRRRVVNPLGVVSVRNQSMPGRARGQSVMSA